MATPLVEIVTCSPQDALEAEAGGAARVELCAAIALGGLTPSLGVFLEAKGRSRLPIMAMVRPRAAGFCYDETELAVMERDAELLIEHGVDGLVVGVLTEEGRVDVARCRRLMRRSAGKPFVFHRAFDVTPDPFEALETLIDLGFTRVLTSGQRATAREGADLIRRLIERAAGRIEVLPGGGIRASNVRELVERTGCDQVHLAPLRDRVDPSTSGRPEIAYGRPGMPEGTYPVVNRASVVAVVEALS